MTASQFEEDEGELHWKMVNMVKQEVLSEIEVDYYSPIVKLEGHLDEAEIEEVFGRALLTFEVLMLRLG